MCYAFLTPQIDLKEYSQEQLSRSPPAPPCVRFVLQKCPLSIARCNIELSRDIKWLLDSGGSVPDGEWLAWTYASITGQQLNGHQLYGVSRSSSRGNRFEDYLVTRIMKDVGKDRIDTLLSRQIGSILSIEKTVGSIERFYMGQKGAKAYGIIGRI